MKTKYAYLLGVFLMVIFPDFGGAAEPSGKDGKKSAKLSSIETYKTPQSTQKTYKVNNDGTNESSMTTAYTHHPGHEVYEDKDSDGRFGEREAALVDRDGDGRKGEREAQLGIESVSQDQKVTVLNNMGMGNSLSSFKASGQTERSSVFEEKKNTETAEEISAPDTEEPEKDQPETQAAKPRRVLVS